MSNRGWKNHFQCKSFLRDPLWVRQIISTRHRRSIGGVYAMLSAGALFLFLYGWTRLHLLHLAQIFKEITLYIWHRNWPVGNIMSASSKLQKLMCLAKTKTVVWSMPSRNQSVQKFAQFFFPSSWVQRILRRTFLRCIRGYKPPFVSSIREFFHSDCKKG